MNGLILLSACCGFVGLSLILGCNRFFCRSGMPTRLAPYAPNRTEDRSAEPGTPSIVGSLRAVLLPIAESFGERLGRLSGIRTDLAARIKRAGSPRSPSEFRLEQFVAVLLTEAVACALALWIRPGPAVVILLTLGTPTLVALSAEHRLERGGSAHRTSGSRTPGGQRTDRCAPRVRPVARDRVGSHLPSQQRRGREDLRAVQMAVRQGTSEVEALRAWADRVRCEGVDRLVGVLSMHRDAADLGALLATEARGIRAAAHRRTIESIERRAQLVWIPVTVATLVPGLILIGVPFVNAMTRITG
ncbi:MAG: hypothetical protein R2789_06525 [Microthrixaceae bacterium]